MKWKQWKLWWCRWITGLFAKGKKGCLKISDIYSPLPNDESEKLADRLEKYWDEEVSRAKKQNRHPNLLRTLCRVFFARYMFIGVLTVLHFTVLRYEQLLQQPALLVFNLQSVPTGSPRQFDSNIFNFSKK